MRTSLIHGGPDRPPGEHERAATDPAAAFHTDEPRCPAQVDDLAIALLELCAADLAGVAGPRTWPGPTACRWRAGGARRRHPVGRGAAPPRPPPRLPARLVGGPGPARPAAASGRRHEVLAAVTGAVIVVSAALAGAALVVGAALVGALVVGPAREPRRDLVDRVAGGGAAAARPGAPTGASWAGPGPPARAAGRPGPRRAAGAARPGAGGAMPRVPGPAAGLAGGGRGGHRRPVRGGRRGGRGPIWSWCRSLVLVTGLVAMAAVDLAVMRIPTRFVYVTGGVVVAGLVAVSLVDGPRRLWGAVLGAAVYGGLLVLHLASPRMLGFGDVRLGTLVGLAVGWCGWDEAQPVFGPVQAVLNAGLLAAVAGSVAGIVLLVVRRRDRPFPFGPAVAAAGLVVFLAGI